MFAAFLYAQNIPGKRYLTRQVIVEGLRGLEPKVSFAGIVSRPDSVLLLCDPSITEESLGRSLLLCLGCKSVVIEASSLERFVTAAQSVIGQTVKPPYRLNIDGAEWEWCLVLCSEQLPSSVSGEGCFGTFSKNVLPVEIVDCRVLLARKRRHNMYGTRIMLGSILNRPWEKALRERGIIPACLTSRTLNQVEKMVLAARHPWCQAGAKRTEPSEPG